MHALSLARKRLKARFEDPATPRPVRLAHHLVESGQGRFLPILSSALAQEILANGYHPAVLEQIYANRTRGGLVGRIADRVVLDLPVHEGMRERLDAAVGEICAAAVLAVRSGCDDFRVLFAPCGLAAEMVTAGERLRETRPDVFERLRWWGVDPDRDGDLLPQAASRARAGGLNAQLIREDLRRHRDVLAAADRVGGFHLISCVGISQLHTVEESAQLIRFYSNLLAPGGTLLVDRWHAAPQDPSNVAASLAELLQHSSTGDVHKAVSAAELDIEREHPTGEGGCVLTVARKPLALAHRMPATTGVLAAA
jgi:hypothetical protein